LVRRRGFEFQQLLVKSDPAAVLAQSEEIKARYAKLFKV
jgi:hypothetical protein